MTCQYDNLRVGQIYDFEDNNVICESCGSDNQIDKLNIKYVSKNKGEHNFKILINNLYCVGCGENLNFFVIPCGGSYYFEKSDVSESLVLSKRIY